MNTAKSKEQQALAKLVRAFVSPSTPQDAMQEVLGGLRACIRSPNDVIACETIPDNHYLKLQALAVRDAFEAATNGMSAPDAFQTLEGLPVDSALAPWKDLVAAILAFYSGDGILLRDSLSRIPADSFPGRAGCLWKSILSRFDDRGRNRVGEFRDNDPFLSRLLPYSDSLITLAEEIREAFDEEMSGLFISGCGRLLRELGQRSENAAAPAALFIMKAIDAKGESPDEFLSTLKTCLGESESLRITALYLSDSRPSLALLFWIKAASRYLEESGCKDDLAAWALVIGRAVDRAREAEGRGIGRAGEYQSALDPLVERFEEIARGMIEAGRIDAVSAYDRLEALAEICRAGLSSRESPKSRSRMKRQLELFA